MDRIIKVPGNKLTPKQLAIVVSLGNLLHDQQRKYSDIPQTQEQRAQRLKWNKKWYKQEDKLSHIYYKDKSPVGMLVQAPDKRDKNISYIGSLFVRPQHRGAGIGKLLLDSAQEEARRQKVKKLLLQYYAGNPAEHLYTRQGFKPGPAQITAVKDLQKQASKTISFPQEQLQDLRKRLQNYQPVWTTRVSKDRTAYNKGDVLQTQLINQPLYVSEAHDISSLQQHPFQKFLTPTQKELLKKYKKMRILKLKPYSWGDNPIYSQTMGTEGKRYRIARLIKAIKQHKLKPSTVSIQDIGALNQKLDNTWGNGVYKEAPQLTVKQFAEEHLPRILKADLQYPILVSQDKKYVYDGLHRLMKAMLQNQKKIKAYRVPKNYLKQIQETI